MTNKLAKIESTQLEEVVKNSGLQIQEGEEIKQSYLPYLNLLAGIQDESTKINFEKPTSTDEMIARDLRLRTVKIRTGAGDLKDDRKRIYLLRGNLEQAAYNLIAASCKLAEEVFTSVEKAREIAEEKRCQELKLVREAELIPYSKFLLPGMDLAHMNEESYQMTLRGAKLQLDHEITEQKKAESERIEREKEQERIRIENEKLKKEAEAKEKQILFERKQAEELAEKARVKADTERKDADEKLRIEREKAERLQAEIRAKEAKELQAKKEADAKIYAEVKAKQLAEKKAKAAPDKMKLTDAIRDLEIKDLDLKNEESRVIEKDIRLKFTSFKLWCETQIKTL